MCVDMCIWFFIYPSILKSMDYEKLFIKNNFMYPLYITSQGLPSKRDPPRLTSRHTLYRWYNIVFLHKLTLKHSHTFFHQFLFLGLKQTEAVPNLTMALFLALLVLYFYCVAANICWIHGSFVEIENQK